MVLTHVSSGHTVEHEPETEMVKVEGVEFRFADYWEARQAFEGLRRTDRYRNLIELEGLAQHHHQPGQGTLAGFLAWFRNEIKSPKDGGGNACQTGR